MNATVAISRRPDGTRTLTIREDNSKKRICTLTMTADQVLEMLKGVTCSSPCPINLPPPAPELGMKREIKHVEAPVGIEDFTEEERWEYLEEHHSDLIGKGWVDTDATYEFRDEDHPSRCIIWLERYVEVHDDE
jgi:hypothetical protein